MRFVHDTKDDALVAAVFLGQLCPYADELLVAGSTLSDDSAVPASVVVLCLDEWTDQVERMNTALRDRQ